MAETEQEILNLARQADDAKDRAYLLLLLKINGSLEANTEATKNISLEIQTHRQEFDQHRIEFRRHVEDEAKLFNQGRGMWRVTAWVLTVVQVSAFAMASWYVSKQDDESRQLRDLTLAHATNQGKHEEIDRTDVNLLARIVRLERKVFGE